MPQTINGFFDALDARDISRDFQFRVIQLGLLNFAEDELVYIRTGTLPAKNVANKAATYHGLAFNVPGTVNFPGSDGWTVKFFCDQAHAIRQKLLDGQTAIFDIATTTGDLSVPGRDAIIQLDLLDETLAVTKTFRLIGAQIRNVGNIDYNLAGDGDLLEFDATFSYHYFETA